MLGLSHVNKTVLFGVCLAIASCSASKTNSKTDLICPNVENVEELLASSKPIIIVGEIHGYNESPKLVEALICHSLKANYKTLFGIEISQDRAEDIRDYVNSSGNNVARKKILSDSRWLSLGDGRQSQASFDILELIRDYKSENLPITIMSFVPSDAALKTLLESPKFSTAYEKSLAENIMDSFELQNPEKMIVLSGNLHAKNGDGNFAGETYPLMATYMSADQTMTLNVSKIRKPMAITLYDAPLEGFDGVYHVPDLTRAVPVKNPFR
jgi:hypothetical protein